MTKRPSYPVKSVAGSTWYGLQAERERTVGQSRRLWTVLLILSCCWNALFGQAYFCTIGDCTGGVGLYRYSEGSIYIGQFSRGARQGMGQCVYPDGSRYVGEWQNDRPHGRGLWYTPAHDLRPARWKWGRREAELSFDSIRRMPEAPRLAGPSVCLEGDCRNGPGIWLRQDGTLYLGTFRDGRPHGPGRAEYPDGSRYQGEWTGGMRQGRGLMIRPDGSRESGCWEQDQLTDSPCPGADPLPRLVESSFVLPVAGCIRGDCTEGTGTYLYRDGGRYAGQFQSGEPHGQGELQMPNGDRYAGSFAGGLYEGYGTLFRADGGMQEGWWRAGELIRSDTEPLEGLYDPAPEVAARPVKPDQIRLWAIIIGVAAYDHMPSLRFTDDDAYRLYAFLKSPEGGALDDQRLKLLIDEQATRPNILETLQTTSGQMGPHDLLLFYFSGHGLPGAFLPYDYNGQSHTVKHSEINALLSDCPARYKLCIADACHAGSLFNAKGGGDPRTLWDRFYEKLATARAGTALILSSKGNETSLESEGLRQGVFSHFLIRGLKGEADADGDQLITLRELFQYVHYRVRDYTGGRQSPVIRGDFDPETVISVHHK